MSSFSQLLLFFVLLPLCIHGFTDMIWKGSIRSGPFFSNNAYITFESTTKIFLLHSPMFRIFGMYTQSTSSPQLILYGINPTVSKFPNEVRLECNFLATPTSTRLQISCSQKKPGNDPRTFAFDFIFPYTGAFSIQSAFFLDQKGMAFTASSGTSKVVHAITEGHMLLFQIESVVLGSKSCVCTGLVNGQFFLRETYRCFTDSSNLQVITFPAVNFQRDPFWNTLPSSANLTYGTHSILNFKPQDFFYNSMMVDSVYNIPNSVKLEFNGLNLLIKTSTFLTEISVYYVKNYNNNENSISGRINQIAYCFGLTFHKLPDETVIRMHSRYNAFVFQRTANSANFLILLSSIMLPVVFSENAQVDYFSSAQQTSIIPFPLISNIAPTVVAVNAQSEITIFLSNKDQVSRTTTKINIFFGKYPCIVTTSDAASYTCKVGPADSADTVNLRFVLDGIYFKTPTTLSFVNSNQPRFDIIAPSTTYVDENRIIYFGTGNLDNLSNLKVVVGNDFCYSPRIIDTGIMACYIKPSSLPGPVSVTAFSSNVTVYSNLYFNYLSYYSSIKFVVFDALITPKEFSNGESTTFNIPILITGYQPNNITAEIKCIGAFFGPFGVPAVSFNRTLFERNGLTWATITTPVIPGLSGSVPVSLSFTIRNMGMFTASTNLRFLDAFRKINILSLSPTSVNSNGAAMSVQLMLQISVDGISTNLITQAKTFVVLNGAASFSISSIAANKLIVNRYDIQSTISVSLSGSQSISVRINGVDSQNSGILNVVNPKTPTVASVTPTSLAVGIVTTLKIVSNNLFGSLFGREVSQDGTLTLVACGTEINIGGVPCENAKCLSNQEIYCDLKNEILVTGSLSFKVAVDGNSNPTHTESDQSISKLSVVSPDQPIIEKISPENGTTAGGVKLIIQGSNFIGEDLNVRVGSDLECIIQHVNSSIIECITTPGGLDGLQLYVNVQVGVLSSLDVPQARYTFFAASETVGIFKYCSFALFLLLFICLL